MSVWDSKVLNACRPLKEAFEKAGIPLLCEAPTNQIFPIFPDGLAEKINKKYLKPFNASLTKPHTCLEIYTSWATNEEAVKDFVKDFEEMIKTE